MNAPRWVRRTREFGVGLLATLVLLSLVGQHAAIGARVRIPGLPNHRQQAGAQNALGAGAGAATVHDGAFARIRGMAGDASLGQVSTHHDGTYPHPAWASDRVAPAHPPHPASGRAPPRG